MPLPAFTDYTAWEGGYDEATGVARVGISYDKLCQGVKPGNVVKVRPADGLGGRRVARANRAVEL